jgi:hypothetical protein
MRSGDATEPAPESYLLIPALVTPEEAMRELVLSDLLTTAN